ncbi:MAG: protein kinase [Phycisphaerales bacterium]|nr:MAG: protein kinase [Phycisphaerales bacterium]
MSAERLEKIVDDFMDRLTAGTEPDLDLDSEGLSASEREELKQCLEAARWLESAIVESSNKRMSDSHLSLSLGDLDETLPVEGGSASGGEDEFAAGQTLGDFEIIREVGRGGMGIVFEARQKSLSRRVALKVLPPGIGWNKTVLQRFLREARAAAQLQHIHIIPVYQIAQEKGVHYFAMQLIEGFPLSRLARSSLAPGSGGALQATGHAGKEGGWPESVPLPSEPAYYRFAARIIRQAALGVEYAHQHGVLHRDIKPSNLMVDGKTDVWIADFGLARQFDDASVTLSGQLVGTLNYMSPEQAIGGKDIDHRTDIYGLGATLYELLTLRTPFVAGSTAELLNDIQELDPTRPTKVNPRVPVDLEVIALKAMEKQPGRRYDSAQEMADDLRRWLDDLPIHARPTTVWRQSYKWMRRKRIILAAAAAVLAVVAGASWITRSATKERGQVEQQLAEAEQRRAVGEVSAGRMLFEQQDYDAAREKFTDAARVFSQFLGDKLAEAINAPGEVVKEAWPYVYLGLIALRDQTTAAQADAARQFELALQFAPNDPLLRSLKLLAETDDFDEIRSVIRLVESLPAQQESGPYAADAFYALAVSVEHYDLQAAIRLITRAIDLRTAFFEALAYRGWLYYEAGELEAALADLNNVIIFDKQPRYFVWRGKVEAAMGAGGQARADFDMAVELDPDSFVMRAERLIWLGQETGLALRRAYGEGAGLEPTLPPALATELAMLEEAETSEYEELYYLGRVYEALGLKGPAAEVFWRAVDHIPAGTLGYVAAAAYAEAGRVMARQGQTETAVYLFNRAVVACAHRDFYQARGDFRRDAGELEDALQDYREAARRGSDAVELHIATAEVLRGLGRLEECQEELELVLEAEPTHWHALSMLGEVMVAQGDPLGAIEPLTILREAYPGDFRVLDQRARARLLVGDETGALADWRAAVEGGLPVDCAELAMAQCYEGLGREEEALRAYGWALAAHERLRGPRMARINIYARTGRASEALQECNRALRVAGSDVGFLLARAGLHERLGREEAAMSDLREVLALQPGLAEAAWNLARLLLYAKDVSLRDTLAVEKLVPEKTDAGRAITQADHRILGHLRYRQGRYAESAEEMSMLRRREVADWPVLAALQSRGFDVGAPELGEAYREGTALELPAWLRELGDQMMLRPGATATEKTPPPEAGADY